VRTSGSPWRRSHSKVHPSHHCWKCLEACSAFTRVTACTLALSPYFVTRFTEGFNRFVTSTIAPVASGWSGCRVGLSPTGKAPPLHGARHKESLAGIGVWTGKPAVLPRLGAIQLYFATIERRLLRTYQVVPQDTGEPNVCRMRSRLVGSCDERQDRLGDGGDVRLND
jgi:hypothetical protein